MENKYIVGGCWKVFKSLNVELTKGGRLESQ